jgi:hypothetical protein
MHLGALSSSRAGSRPAGLRGLALKLLCVTYLWCFSPTLTIANDMPNLILYEGRVTSAE